MTAGRARSTVSIKKLDDGKWQVRWRESDGSQRARRFRTKAEATAFEASTLAEIASGKYVATASQTGTTVAELADLWLAASLHLAPGTLHTYRRDLNRYILPSFGMRRLRDVNSAAIQQFLGDEVKTLAPSSVHRHYRTMRTMFEWAKTAKILSTNPCDSVRPPKLTKDEPNFLTIEQIDALADAMPERYRAFVLVGAYGGFRFGELCGLRRGNVDGNKVKIVEQLSWRDGRALREPPKTLSSRRTVPLPSSVADILDSHLRQFSQPGADGLVFPNKADNPIAPSFRTNVWRPACYRAGLASRVRSGSSWKYENAPKIHDLRHTAVALAIAAGAHPKQIQARLGHASITTTLNTYGHLFATLDDDLTDRLDRLREI